MKKSVLNLFAVSMLVSLSVTGGLQAVCSLKDSWKNIEFRNSAGQGMRFLVMDAAPGTAGVIAMTREVQVPANKTKQISYCKNGKIIIDVTGVGPVNISSGIATTQVVKSATVQGDGSYSDPEFSDMAGVNAK